MADGDKLVFDVRNGRVSLKEGKLFRGGVYLAQVVIDGAVRETALLRLYDEHQRELCLVECKAEAWQVALNTEAVSKVFRDGCEIVPLRAVVYDGEQVLADGTVMLYWTPTAVIVDGKPIDTKGDQGKQGIQGKEGKQGPQGDSLYKTAQDNGFQGTEADWVQTIANAHKVVENAEEAQAAAETARREAQIFATTAGNSANVAGEILAKVEKAAWYGKYTDSQGKYHPNSIESMVHTAEGYADLAKGSANIAEKMSADATAANNAVQLTASEISKKIEEAEDIADDARYWSNEAKKHKDTVLETASNVWIAREAVQGNRNAVEQMKTTINLIRDSVVYMQNEVNKNTQAASTAKGKAEAAQAAAEEAQIAVEGTVAQVVQSAAAAIAAKDEANQAKTDAVKAKGEAEGFKKDAEGFAKSASESAEQASQSAQQAESAKDAVGDVGERLDKVDDRLSQIPLSQKITYRDVLGELIKANGWDDAPNAVIKRIATTSNGNIVVIYQNYNTYVAIYVLSQSGERLAQQSLPTSYAFAQITRIHLVDYNGEIFVLTDGICYKVTDTTTSATISEIGTIDFNGLATTMPTLYNTASTLNESIVLTIGDRALIGKMVIDLTNLRVIQILSAYPIFAYGYTHGESDTAIVTLSDNKVAYLTLNENGLIDITNDTAHSNAYFVTKNSGSDTHGWIKQLDTGFCDFTIMRKNSSTAFASTKCLEFFKGRIVSRGNAFCGITNDGRIAVVTTSITVASYGANPNYHFAGCEMSSLPHLYRIIGVDPRGAWFLAKVVYVWAGYRPTAPLIRVTF